jgi:hypothetical protein
MVYGEPTANMVFALGGENRRQRVNSIHGLGTAMASVCGNPNFDVRFDVGPTLKIPFEPAAPSFGRDQIQSAQFIIDTDAPAMVEFRRACGCLQEARLCALCWTATLVLHKFCIGVVQSFSPEEGRNPLTYFTWGKGAHSTFLNDAASSMSRTMRVHKLSWLLGCNGDSGSTSSYVKYWHEHAPENAQRLLHALTSSDPQAATRAVLSCTKAVDKALADPKHLHRGLFSARNNGGIVAPVDIDKALSDPALLSILGNKDGTNPSKWKNYTLSSDLFVRYDCSEEESMDAGINRAAALIIKN